MKILFPSIFYLPHVIGGIEYYIQNLAQRMILKGYEVKVAVPEYNDSPKGEYIYEGIQVIRYPGFTSANKMQMSGLEPNESLHHFKKMLNKERPDIVHFNQLTNSSGISLEHITAPKEIGAKVIYTNHMAEFICQRSDFMYMGETKCDGIVTVKKCTACLIQSRGLNKFTAHSLSFIDDKVAKIIGENNYLQQVSPIIFPGFYTRWHINKVQSVIASADVFVSVANWCTNLLKQNNWYKDNCITIPNGLLNKVELTNTGFNKFDGKRPLKIIYVGRIFPIKGLDILIKAVKEISSNLIQVNIYGPDGAANEHDYYSYCRDLAKSNINICFKSEAPNNEVVQLMAENDVLCIPSRVYEMAPLIIHEAMAAGTPIIGADLPAIKEWVNDGENGFIFPVNDEITLRNKLMSLINDPGLLNSFKKKLLPYRSFDEVADNYHSIYQSLFQ